MNFLAEKFDRIDADSRLLFAEMTLADPLCGSHVRTFIELNIEDHGWSPEHSGATVMCWLADIREACGLERAGHG